MKKFDLGLFLGKWYEVARIRNSFEPDMTNVTAQYNLNTDGTIQVINTGYVGGKKRQITGLAKRTDLDNILNVSFFPGVYSNYKVLAIGGNYEYALVGGDSDTYLWILSRTVSIDSKIISDLVSIAEDAGYRTELLNLTEQN